MEYKQGYLDRGFMQHGVQFRPASSGRGSAAVIISDISEVPIPKRRTKKITELGVVTWTISIRGSNFLLYVQGLTNDLQVRDPRGAYKAVIRRRNGPALTKKTLTAQFLAAGRVRSIQHEGR